MNKIKIAHTADIHFGVENYGHIDQITGLHTRLLDFEKAFKFIVNKSIQENIDCFIFAGDAYKNCHPSPTHQKILLQTLLPLLDAKIPLIIVVGNHDYAGNFSKAHALDVFNHMRSEGCYVFSKPGKISLKTKNGILQIVAIPWPTRSNLFDEEKNNFYGSSISDKIGKNLKNIIKKYANSLDQNEAAILTGHLTIMNGNFSGSERSVMVGRDPIFSISDVAIEPFDYVALGHLHRHQNLNKDPRCPVVYSGSPEKIDFGEINDLKGFCLIEIEKTNFAKKTNYEFIKTPTRNFIEIYLKCNSSESMEFDFLQCIENIDLSESIVKIFYTLSPDIVKLPTIGLFEKIFKNAWHIADIQCLNSPKIYRNKLIKVNKNQNIYEMIESYCKNSEEHHKNIQEYIEIVKNCEEKYGIQ